MNVIDPPRWRVRFRDGLGDIDYDVIAAANFAEALRFAGDFCNIIGVDFLEVEPIKEEK